MRSPHGGVLALLIGLTAFWFVLGIVNGFVLPLMFAAYQEAGEATTWGMRASLACLIFFPMTCVSTIVGGWRLLMGGRPVLAVRVALLPIPLLVLTGLLLATAWP